MRKIWAVARHMVAQGIRMRVAAAVIVIFVVLMPTLPFLLKGDGTLRGHVQVFITYSLLLSTLLLSLLTLALSTASLCGEVRDKQLFILDTKPIRRWQIVAGKWLGIMIINSALLAFMGASCYAFVHVLAQRESGWDQRAYQTELDRLRERVLCARRSVKPQMPDLEKFVDEGLRRDQKEGKIPGDLTEAMARRRLRAAIRGQLQAVPYGYAREWVFRNVPRSPAPWDELSIRFRYNLASEWSVGAIDGLWRVGGPKSKRTLDAGTRFNSGSFHEFQVPTGVIGPDGTVQVRFLNRDDDRGTVSFPLEDGIELLVYVDSFAMNFTRGLLLVVVKLGFLAATGLFCSTFLTLPVAVTLALCIYLLTGISGFIAEMAEVPWTTSRHAPEGEAPAPPPWFEKPLRVYLNCVTFVIPPFEQFATVSPLNSGREISWPTVAKGFGILLLLRGGVLALLGCYIFQRRELAGLRS